MGIEIPVFWGCRAITGDLAFELSIRSIAEELGVKLNDLGGQACCGEPVRSLSLPASCYLALRPLALAKEGGHDLLFTPCPKGFYMMTWSLELISRSRELREKVSKALGAEGLSISNLADPVDLMGFLIELVGPEELSDASGEGLGLRAAVHPGCYFLRSVRGAHVRLWELRTVFKAIGVEAPYYPGMLDCCGGSLELTRPDAALTLAGSKLKAALDAGLECLIVLCPSCFHMLDGRQEEALAAVGAKGRMSVLYLAQAIGLAIGLSTEKLGLQFNRSPIEDIAGGP